MGYLLAIGLITLGLCNKKAKWVTVLLIIYMWVLISLNTTSADYLNYQEMFEHCFDPAYALHEPGYMLLCKICKFLGMSFRGFRMVVATVVIFFTFKGLSYYSKNINYVLALYLIFPFVGAVSGLRSGVCMSIVLYAMRYLFSTRKHACMKYIIWIMIAVTFHYSALFYLLYLFARNKKVLWECWLAIAMVVIPSGILLAQKGIFYQIADLLTDSDKVLFWFDNANVNFSPLYTVSMMLMLAYMFLFLRAKHLIAKTSLELQNEGIFTSKENIDIMIKVEILTSFAFTGAIFSGVVFLRLLLTAIPLYYAVHACVFLSNTKINDPSDLFDHGEKRVWRILLPIFALIIHAFVYVYWIGGAQYSAYQNNLLFIALS